MTADSIDDAMPDPSDAAYVAVLRCTACGATGQMYSTGEPRPEQYWDCDDCGTNDAKHDIILMSDAGQEVDR